MFGFVPFVLVIILTSGCVTTSVTQDSHVPRDYVTGADAVEIWMKGRVIIQGMNGIQYANDMPLAVVKL